MHIWQIISELSPRFRYEVGLEDSESDHGMRHGKLGSSCYIRWFRGAFIKD